VLALNVECDTKDVRRPLNKSNEYDFKSPKNVTAGIAYYYCHVRARNSRRPSIGQKKNSRKYIIIYASHTYVVNARYLLFLFLQSKTIKPAQVAINSRKATVCCKRIQITLSFFLRLSPRTLKNHRARQQTYKINK